MRAYIDTRGRFYFYIPDHWNCKEEDKDNLVSFMFGDNTDDCFQINCIPTDKGQIPLILSQHRFVENAYSKSGIAFSQRSFNADEMRVSIFEAKVENHFVLALHTFSNKKTDSKIVEKHLKEAIESLNTLVIVDPKDWLEAAAHARFDRFMVSLLASIDLTNKAQDKGSSIELVILFANRIDALLRLALILKKQLQDLTDSIDVTLIYQGDEDQPIFERSIYTLALEGELISESLFEKLQKLYKLRNKVVHRYITSDLKTNDIIGLVVEYMDIHVTIGAVVGALEQEQFEKGIGIYGDGNNPKEPVDPARMKGLLTELHDKHANARIIKEMTIKARPSNKVNPGKQRIYRKISESFKNIF